MMRCCSFRFVVLFRTTRASFVLAILVLRPARDDPYPFSGHAAHEPVEDPGRNATLVPHPVVKLSNKLVHAAVDALDACAADS
uniref:Putative secreted protein n=1 Tax=Ixodes ricinus TaxID=34613 RepID=A0A6B0U697_IXORI